MGEGARAQEARMDFCFYLITDRKATASGRSIEEVLHLALEAGAKGVLLREKDLPGRELVELAGRVRALTLRHDARLLISERVDVALAVDADGVHVSGRSLPAAKVRELIGEEKLMGVSTHSVEEALAAQADGADFVTFSPVFESVSKPGYGPAAGADTLSMVCRSLTIPVFALGGINRDNAVIALKSGAYGIAVISAVVSAAEPGRAVRDIIDNMKDYKLKRVI